MAKKKGGGSSRNGRDSRGPRLGINQFGGEQVLSGNFLVRQHGTTVHPGWNVGLGRDYTLFATMDGFVKYETLPTGRKKVHVFETPEGPARG